MFESGIELKLADCPEQVAAIVRETIQKVYPHYYPSGAVQFFLDLHSEARVLKIIQRFMWMLLSRRKVCI